MHCLKCGSEIEDGKVFCDACARDMEQYPVKPGTPIQLPRHEEEPAPKPRRNRRKRNLKPEEQVRRLHSTVFWLSLALLVVVLAFCVAAYFVIHLLNQRDAALFAEAAAFWHRL